MTLQAEDIKKIAYLSRIHVTEADIEDTKQQLNKILDLIEQLQSVNTEGILPMTHPQNTPLRLRDDVITETNHRDEYLEIAPQTEQGFFLVPRVIE